MPARRSIERIADLEASPVCDIGGTYRLFGDQNITLIDRKAHLVAFRAKLQAKRIVEPDNSNLLPPQQLILRAALVHQRAFRKCSAESCKHSTRTSRFWRYRICTPAMLPRHGDFVILPELIDKPGVARYALNGVQPSEQGRHRPDF
jgi:hypothetical protein